jgi:microsomal dipeptidase-like Zn-dependent dipeptidase
MKLNARTFTRAALLAGAVALATSRTAVAGARPRPTPTPTPTPTAKPKLWGFADLHAHPATHMGFGANDGKDGLISGSPGLTANNGELADLLPCNADKHTGSLDLVEDGTQVMAFTALDGSTGANHTKGGWPNFYGWPSARSLTHQQMHVDWIYRAWQGGLRLMVASATDNKLLSALWANSAELPSQWDLNQISDWDSAVKQLDYIWKMAGANPTWMQIAKNAADAEKIIAKGKLALVLGVEMDDLSADDIATLHDVFWVNVVNPIHLANNRHFGGSGVYSNLFNTMNWELWTGPQEHYKVRYESTIGFRLGAPLKMGTDVLPLLQPPFVFKDYVTPTDSPNSACDEGLDFCHFGDLLTIDGQANADGLNGEGKNGLVKLWKKGMVIDIAHMSDYSQLDTISMAKSFGTQVGTVPIIDSHTDLRAPITDPGSRSVTERKLLPSTASQISALGGMIGLGTEGDIGARTISKEQGTPMVKLSDGQDYVYDLENPRLRLGIGTGADDKHEDSFVHVHATIDGTEQDLGYLEFPHKDDLMGHYMTSLHGFDANSVNWATVKLPAGTKLASLSSLRLTLDQTDPSCVAFCDNWDLQRFEVYYVGRTSIARLYSRRQDPWIHRFKARLDSEGSPDASFDLLPDGREIVDIEMVDGNDPADNDKGKVSIQYVGGGVSDDIWFDSITQTGGMFSGLYRERPYPLARGTTVFDIESVKLGIGDIAQVGCGLECDNWDLNSVRISQPDPNGTRVVIERSSSPAFRFTGENPNRTLAVRVESEPPIFAPSITAPNAQVQWVQIAIQTDDDDLQFGVELTGTLVVDGLDVPPFSLNQGAKWFDGTSHLTIVKLPAPVKVEAIRRLMIHYGDQKNDDWKIGSIEIQALGKPITTWTAQYQKTLGIMNGRGIAIGTDLNGLNPLIPFSETRVTYPLAPPATPAGYVPLGSEQVAGNRHFDFHTEGISNVGQLPEFLQAIQNVSYSTATEPLFHSADDFVQMWKRIEKAAAFIP